MKILMLADTYPPVIGGGEIHVESLSRELSRRGHQVCVCTIKPQGLPEYEQREGVAVYRLEGLFQKFIPLFKDPQRRYHPPVQDPFISNKLRQIIEEISPDIIHAHGRIINSVLALKHRPNIPIVFTLHGFALVCPKTTLLRENTLCDDSINRACIRCGKDFYGLLKSILIYCGTRLASRRVKSIDKYIAVSMFTKDIHTKHLGLNDEDIVVIPNFVDLYTETEDNSLRYLPEDYILFVGSLTPAKGVDLLIEAFQRLRTKTSLVIIGAPHPDYHYESKDNIYFMENVPHHNVLTAMSKCRFIIVPSILPETFAMVAVEAMSQHKAVIASSIGGLKEVVINNETGILVPPNDLDSLSEAISLLLQEPDKASRMGETGYRIFRGKYTAETVLPRIIELYESMI